MAMTRDNKTWQACDIIEVRHPVIDSESDEETTILSNEGNLAKKED